MDEIKEFGKQERKNSFAVEGTLGFIEYLVIKEAKKLSYQLEA